MGKKGRMVEGFCFTDEKLAEQAKREADGVRYIKEHTNMENPEVVLQLYHKLMEEKLFETPVGIGFLKELRDFLRKVPGVQEEELEPIPVEVRSNEDEVRNIKREKTAFKGKMERRLEQEKKRLRTSLAINLFLVILVIGMIVVTMTNNHPNIINYENKIVDKYAQWQQELEEREQTVREKEQELGITP